MTDIHHALQDAIPAFDPIAVAATISRGADRIEPCVMDDLVGVEIKGGDAPVRFLLDAESVPFLLRPRNGEWLGSRSRRDALGAWLPSDDAGGVREIGAGVDAHLLRVLERIDPLAMSLVSSIPAFSSDAYVVARSIDPDSAFARMLREMPALSMEIELLAHDERIQEALDTICERGPLERIDMRRRMIAADEPLLVYGEIVAVYSSWAWPGAAPPPERILEAARIAGRVVAAGEVGLHPYHVAFLAIGPDEATPRDPAAMGNALWVVDRWKSLFGRAIGIAPSDSHEEFERTFGRDWSALAASLRSGEVDPDAMPRSDHIGDAVAWDLALGMGRDPSRLIGTCLSYGISERTRRRCVEGRRPFEIASRAGAWNRGVGGTAKMEDLSRCGLLPEDLRDIPARELATRLGVDVDDSLRIMDRDGDCVIDWILPVSR